MRTVVVIPAYNAEASIGTLVQQLISQHQVIVVDDGSTDRTAEAAAAAGAAVLRQPRNGGKGAALRRGFAAALERGAEAVVTMDGDGQHDPADLPHLAAAAAASRAGIVLGNRMSSRGTMPRVRWYTNRAMSAMLSRLCRQAIPDSQCGFRWIAREVLERCPLSAERFEIESELLVAASRAGFAIASVPVRSIYDRHTSTIRPWQDTWRFLRFLARGGRT